jgi:hypothetical protein
MALNPWPIMPSSCVGNTDGDDNDFFESGHYLRDLMHHNPHHFDLSSSQWPSLLDHVIRDDVCTEDQLKLIELRSKMGASRVKAIEKRRAKVDPRFFEEVRPTLEKDAALAQMRARWASDKATALQEHDTSAEYGAQFVAWYDEKERCWPKPSRVWLQRVKWFAMWRSSQRAKQECSRKKKAKLGQKKAISCAESDASWEVLSECSDSSWQAVSEVSETSWLELATESDIVAHMDAKVAELAQLKLDCQKDLESALPALDVAVQALRCLSKKDICEVKAMKKPPFGVALVGKALCTCFSIGPKRLTSDAAFDYWCASQKLLGDAKFLNRMINYDKDNISDETFCELLHLDANPCFQPEVVKKASVAGAGLCMWVRAITAYARVAREISPKRHALKQAEMELDIAQNALASRTQNEAPSSVADDNTSQQSDEDLESIFESAENSLLSIAKADLAEVKSMCSPPVPVMAVCSCVMILRPLRKEDASLGWRGVKAMLGDPNLLRAMQEYDNKAVSDQQVERVRQILNKDKLLFEGTTMQNVSKAAYGLLQWVKAVVKYHDAAKRAKTKGLRVDGAEEYNLQSPCSTATPSTPLSGVDIAHDIAFENDEDSAAISFPAVDLKALQELKRLSKPPGGIDSLLAAIMELQAGINSRVEVDEDGYVKDKTWKAAQKLLNDPRQFSQDLKDFEDAAKNDRVPDANIVNAKRIQQDFVEAFSPEAVAKKSMSAVGLAQWFGAMLAHFSPLA